MTTTFYPCSPVEIRDGTIERLTSRKTSLGLTNVFKARTQPGQDDQIPYAIVWLAGERTEAAGDPNVGAPSFAHTLTLVVDVVTRAGTDDGLDANIVGITENVRGTLLTDPTWIELFEGIERCSTRYAYPKDAQDRLAQAIIEIEVTFQSIWEPNVPNDFAQVTVRGQTAGSPASMPRTLATINVETN